MLQPLLLVLLVAVSYAQATDVCKMCKYSFTCCVQCLMCCCSSGTISGLMIAPAHNITIESGTTASLNCSASVQGCSMCSVSLVWKHGNVPLSGANFIPMDGTLSSILPLTVNMSNQGEYSCQTNGTMAETVESVYITAASENTVYFVQF